MSDIFREVDEDVRQDKMVGAVVEIFDRRPGLALAIVAATAFFVYRGHVRQTRPRRPACSTRRRRKCRKRTGRGCGQAAFEELAKTAPPGYQLLARLRAAEEKGLTDRRGGKGTRPHSQRPEVAPLWQELARLRAGILRVDDADQKEVEQRFAPLLNGSFRHSAREYMALSALKRGDFEEAGKLLDQIVVDSNAPANLRQRAQGFLSLVRGGGKFSSAPAQNPARRIPTSPGRTSRTACDGAAQNHQRSRFMSFTVAIIGRPNVGKSTLFNRLVGKKLALVDDQPGVTRDRRSGEAKLGDLVFTVIDTAGLEEGGAESLTGRMRAQTEAAIEDADAIFFVMDARVGRHARRPAFRFARAPRRKTLDRHRQQGRGAGRRGRRL